MATCGTILVADDEALARQSLVELLQEEGYHVYPFEEEKHCCANLLQGLHAAYELIAHFAQDSERGGSNSESLSHHFFTHAQVGRSTRYWCEDAREFPRATVRG